MYSLHVPYGMTLINRSNILQPTFLPVKREIERYDTDTMWLNSVKSNVVMDECKPRVPYTG